jgi:acetyl esterase/lipase
VGCLWGQLRGDETTLLGDSRDLSTGDLRGRASPGSGGKDVAVGKLGVTTTVYRTVDAIDLSMRIFEPTEVTSTAAVVFLHGGGLTSGSPDYFDPECDYLASRGIAAASAAYRLLPNQARSALDCIADAQAATAWIRSRAGLGAGAVVTVGFSAGGLLAGATAFDAPLEELDDSCRPDALVLLNSVIDTTWPAKAAVTASWPPPTLILHARRDTMAPISRSRRLAADLAAAGHACELIEFDGAHTFHRPYAKNGSAGVIGVLKSVDRFLTELGHLPHDESAGARIEALGEAMLADVLARRQKRAHPASGA